MINQTKSDFKDNDAIVDDVAGQAYMEQFALETFQRADNAMKANKATRYDPVIWKIPARLITYSRQTADTFQAAATFLDVCQIWGPLEPELASKIKFAKYHSLRILKAMKAGEDPNLSNPAPEPDTEPPLDPNDPEVRMLNGSSVRDERQHDPRQPSVTEVQDEENEPPNAQRAPSVSPQPDQNQSHNQSILGENYYHDAVQPEVSPLDPASVIRDVADTGGYFPTAPGAPDHAHDGDPYVTSPIDPGSPPTVELPDAAALPPPRASEHHSHEPITHGSMHSFPPPDFPPADIPPPVAPVPNYPSTHPPASVPYSHNQYVPTPTQIPQPPTQPSLPTPRAPQRQPAPVRSMVSPPTSTQPNYATDEEAILKAQKHARWAISALNFEDVPTAVKELRGALEILGAEIQQ